MNNVDLFKITPQDYIRYLFSKTDNNNLPIVYEPQSLGAPYLINYKVDWREGDVDTLIRHFSFWEESLIKFGKMHNELEDKATREALLTADEIALWNICEANFDGRHAIDTYFDINSSGEELSPESKRELIEMHNRYEADALEHFAFCKTSPADMLRAAKRLKTFSALCAPDAIINIAACKLAEEMVIYYFTEEGSEVYSVIDRVEDGLPL